MAKKDSDGNTVRSSGSMAQYNQQRLADLEISVERGQHAAYKSALAQCVLDLEHAAGYDDDIYYKLIPSDGGKAWHAYAYWKYGRWVGYYVYALITGGDFAGGLSALAGKVCQVRAGTRRPSLDARRGTSKANIAARKAEGD
jgi:hypothetical protein